MINKLILLSIIVMISSCTVSPRYNANPKQNKNKKTAYTKNKKSISSNKKIYKGISSWYGPNFHGKLTANGEVFDMYGITAAHKSLPLNTVAKVTNLDNGKSIILRINDRGPYVGNRILDCSMGAAKKLDFYNQGTAFVKIEIIEFGDNEYMHH